MIINHNLGAMNANRNMNINSTAASKSMQKLSSGLRINTAGDDAAGLAISEKMRGQIRGLDQASSNAQDGISLVQTAEGALNETTSILQRMRELSVQASTDTNTSDDRAAIQTEMDQLNSEVNRIGNSTEFNTKKLLNGGAGLSTNFTVETVAGVSTDWISVKGGTSDTASTGNVSITAATEAIGATTGTLTVASTAGAKTFSVNGYTLSFTAAGNATDNDTLVALINANSDKIGATASVVADDTMSITSTTVGSASKLTVVAAANTITAGAMTAAANTTSGTDATITEVTIAGNYVAKGNTITVTSGTYKGLELEINGNATSSTGSENVAAFSITGNGALALQIGANKDQEMSISIGDMRSAALGLSTVNVTTQASAKESITTIDNAIKTVSAERSKLGAYTNRLEHTINNLGTSSENLTSAESRIRDVDMAKEMSTFSKNNILSQAAQAMLAQSNQMPQQVLQLLR